MLGGDQVYVYANDQGKTYPFSEDIITDGRVAGFRDGCLWADVRLYNYTYHERGPLFLIDDFEAGPGPVQQFDQSGLYVCDFIVRNGRCYILSTEERSKKEFQGFVPRSSDLKDWTKMAEFTVPAIPLSFEILEDMLFVGLGNGGSAEDIAD